MKLSERVNLVNLFILAALISASPISNAIESKYSVEKADVIYEMKQGDTLLGLVAK